MKPTKEYLGDGVYFVWDGETLTLTTDDGSQVNNRILLETEVLEAFFAYLKQWTAQPR